MIMVHTLWMYGDVTTQRDSWLGHVLHIAGKGTAAFLVAMGVSLMVARDQSLGGAVRRGLILLVVGYVMNVLKFIVPIAVGTMPASFIAAYGWTQPLDAGQLLYLVGTGDILQLAGLALLILGVVRRYVRTPRMLMVLAAGVAAASHVLSGFRLGVPGLDYVCDLLWGAEYNVYFPVFPWLACILVGMYFGAWYVANGRDQDALARHMLRVGIPALVAGAALLALDFDAQFGDFFHLGAGGIAWLVGLNLIGLWAVRQIERRFAPRRLVALLRYCSERVTTLYVLQWTLVCWGMAIIGYQTLGVSGVLAMIPVMLALTFLAQLAIDRIVRRRDSSSGDPLRTLGTLGR